MIHTLLALSLASFAQPELVADLRERAVHVRSIDPADDDFADLEPLAPLLAQARIVNLGEQSHGDGAAFLAKVRLIKFLHQRLGFDVLIFESGFFDCRLADDALAAGAPAEFSADMGVFGIWTQSAQVMPLFEYVRATRSTDRPLTLAGFDCQNSGSADALPRVVIDFFNAVPDLLTDRDHTRLRAIIAALIDEPASLTDDDETFLAALEVLARDERLARVHPPAETASMRRILLNARAFVSMQRVLTSEKAIRDPSPVAKDALNLREKMMADTLVFLARDLYPDRKLITWGASAHLMHGSRGVTMRDPLGKWSTFEPWWIPMGDHVRAQLAEETYTVAFLAHSGQAGSVFGRPWDLPPPPAGSLDALCHDTGLPFLFLDLRSLPQEHPLRQPRVARPRGYAEMRADWATTCDAFFFTDRMTPSTRR